MLKDLSYHEAAIEYNEKLAKYAEDLAETLDHEEIRRWCCAVGKQHRFHAKRHRATLSKMKRSGQEVKTTEVVEAEPTVQETAVDADACATCGTATTSGAQ